MRFHFHLIPSPDTCMLLRENTVVFNKKQAFLSFFMYTARTNVSTEKTGNRRQGHMQTGPTSESNSGTRRKGCNRTEETDLHAAVMHELLGIQSVKNCENKKH